MKSLMRLPVCFPLLACASLGLGWQTARAADAARELDTNLTAAIRLNSGFRLHLAASEPMVVNPVALAFDDRGRLYVAEQPPSGTPSTQPGRIRLLSDPDEDGTFKASTVFAEDVPGISGIACYNGGVFVAAAREILYLKDTEGTGRANQRRIVFGGFTDSAGMARPDAQLHSIVWGPDNRFHVGASGLGLPAGGPGANSAPTLPGGTDFSFDPRSPQLAPESGISLSGVAFDHRGLKFTSDFDRPLRLVMYREQSLNRNPFAGLPPQFVEVIRSDTPMYRVTTVPLAGSPNATTNVTVTYYMTNARAPFIYRSPFAGTSAPTYGLVADPGAGLVHRQELRMADLVVTATRPTEDARTEFITSADADFHPMHMTSGPDGGLWLADRRALPTQGRIYRIFPAGAKPLPLQNLEGSNTYHLVSLLSHPNAWHRETGSRLLYERRDAAATSLLTNVIANSRVSSARVGALWALAGLGAAPEPIVFRAARDTDPIVREHALVLLEQASGKGISEDFLRYLGALARDGSPRVRYQLANTLGTLPRPGRAQTLAEILLRDPANPWVASAVMNAVDQDAVQLMSLLLLNLQARTSPAILEFQVRLAEMIGVSGRQDLAQQLVSLVRSSGLDYTRAYTILAGLADGLDRARLSLGGVVPPEIIDPLYNVAFETTLATTADAALRAQAVRFVGLAAPSYAEFGDWLVALLGGTEPLPVLLSSINVLGRYSNPMVATLLLQRLPTFAPQPRREAITALLARTERAPAVLNAIDSRALRASDLLPSQLDYLRTHSDPAVSGHAVSVLGPLVEQRPQVVQRFASSTTLSGSPASGRNIFLQRCASCHRLGQDGLVTGLDLLTAKGRTRAQLLSDVVEPNAEIRPALRAWVVDTKHGRTYTGMLRNENPSSVVLQDSAGAQTVIPKQNVMYHRAQPWSLMPANLVDDLNPQAMADLLTYLSGANSPQSPRTRPATRK